MPLESNARIAKALAERGYNAEREAITLLAGATDPSAAVAAAVDRAPDDALRITGDHVREAIADADGSAVSPDSNGQSPVETEGSTGSESAATETASGTATNGAPDTSPANGATADTEPANSAPDTEPATAATDGSDRSRDPALRDLAVGNDMTGRSTGTGEYSDFVTTFRDRYERLSKILRGRVNHRPAEAIADMPGGSDAAMIGLVNDVRSTKSGHWLIELEDTTGTFPALVMKDKGLADVVDEILLDECVAVEGTLADDAGILFADSLHFPDVPRTHRPGGADRHVQAALISDVHVGSDEFMADAWHSFTNWLHTPEADPVEYLLLAGDMVEGVGVYPGQDEELEIVDIYEQYEAFAELLKEVPADTEVVMIPGNHDAVRLAEPQPGFDDEIRSIMDVHDARIVSNPATVSVEGVEVLMYHGVSLDEVIAELPEEKASYDEP
ncbi:MAG: DNA-directed DNA polymerase II small subunit, partial [Halorubrum sp.]